MMLHSNCKAVDHTCRNRFNSRFAIYCCDSQAMSKEQEIDIGLFEWLVQIGFECEKAKEYSSILKENQYSSLSDLIYFPPSKDDLKEYGLKPGKFIQVHKHKNLKIMNKKLTS